jgi:hypothetical protein
MIYPLLPGAGRIPPLASALPPEGSLPAGVIVSRPCACGIRVTASRLDPGPGVREHNATAEHRAWGRRVDADWQGEP